MYKVRKLAKKYNVTGPYEKSFFEPFKSKEKRIDGRRVHYSAFNDAKRNAKAIVFYPMVHVANACTSIVKGLRDGFIGLLALGIGALTCDSDDVGAGLDGLTGSLEFFGKAISFIILAVAYCLGSAIRLVTHTLATTAYSTKNAGKFVINCFKGCEREHTPSMPSHQ